MLANLKLIEEDINEWPIYPGPMPSYTVKSGGIRLWLSRSALPQMIAPLIRTRPNLLLPPLKYARAQNFVKDCFFSRPLQKLCIEILKHRVHLESTTQPQKFANAWGEKGGISESRRESYPFSCRPFQGAISTNNSDRISFHTEKKIL